VAEEENAPAVSSLLTALVVLIALEHLWFLVLEMLLWTRPIGLKTFRNTAEGARQSAALAANQGLYNGFLAVGLLWGTLHPHPGMAWQIKVFLLACVVVAGVFGAVTVSRRIFYVQALPALVGLGLAWLS
jgi:putative membrane protein